MRAAAVFALALVAGTAAAAPFPAAPFRIDHTFEPTGYRARIALDDPRFVGHIEIDGTLAKPAQVLWLHGVGLSVQSARAVGPRGDVALEVSPPRGDQKIGLRAPRPLPAGRWTLVLDYTGTIYDHLPRDAYEADTPSFMPHSKSPPALALFHRTLGGKTFFYTQSEEIYARWIFPCIDEPDRKVPWQLTLDIPAGDLAASNAPIARTTALDAGHTRVEFAPTAPLPSYLVAFAVGPFDVVGAGRDTYGMPIRILALPGHDGAVAHAAQLAPRLLDELEAYFAMRYPYPKLDLVEVPGATCGMENPGVITFDVRCLEPSDAASVIAHELSHQWFGDLVTPRWWDDIWLNESFAEWMGQRLLRQLAGDAYDPIARRADDRWALGGGWVLHQAYDDDRALRFREMPFMAWAEGAGLLDLVEAWLGPDTLQRALREYATDHANGNVTMADLFDALDRAAGSGTGAVMQHFVDDDDAFPRITASLSCGRRPRVHFGDVPWALRACVAYDRDGARAEVCGRIDEHASDLALPAHACPRWVFPAAGGTGPYRITWTPALIDRLLASGWSALTPAERRMLLWDTEDAAAALRVFVHLARDPAPLLPSDAAYVLALARRVPADLRPAFDAFVQARFGPAARGVHFRLDPDRDHDTQHDELTIVELDALTGDPALAAEAARVAPPPHDDPFTEARTTLAVRRDPTLAAKLLQTASAKDWGMLEGLSHADGLSHALSRAVVQRIGNQWLLSRLFQDVCDPTARAHIAAIAPTAAMALQFAHVDDCIATRAQLEPVLRAWLGRP